MTRTELRRFMVETGYWVLAYAAIAVVLALLCGGCGVLGSGDTTIEKVPVTLWGMLAALVAAAAAYSGISLLWAWLTGAATFMAGLFFSTKSGHSTRTPGSSDPPPSAGWPWGWTLLVGLGIVALFYWHSRKFRGHVNAAWMAFRAKVSKKPRIAAVPPKVLS